MANRKPRPPLPPASNSKYRPVMLVDIYLLTRLKYTDVAIAASLGVHLSTYDDWKRNFPDVKETIAKAKGTGNGSGDNVTFQEYIYGQLAPDTKKVWDSIMMFEDHADGWEKITAILTAQTTRTRQQLYIHAMVHTCFNLSEAGRITGVTYRQVKQWARDDVEFTQLLEELDWHKKNFFEQGLVDLVRMRNPQAVMFANKTMNRDRGYVEQLDVTHKGFVQVEHTLRLEPVDVAELDLPLETLIQIQEAMVKRREIKELELKQVEPIETAG